MEDDADLPPERETKDFEFRQLKKTRLFNSPEETPKERSNLLAISNKYGLFFAGGPPGLKIYHTKDLLVPVQPGQDLNDIVVGPPGIDVPLKHPAHHLALSSDHLTLSICTASTEGTLIAFYDVRTLLNKAKPQKQPFACYKLANEGSITVSDLKWNPAIPAMVAVCLSDGSISVLQVADAVSVYASLPASLGVTSVCWSPKGKQLAVGKQNGTVVQFLPNLQEKKVIPCPSFYDTENPVKVLDVLWVSTYVFVVVYAAADGSLEATPQLVVVMLPKKEDKRGECFLNFTETCYSSCAERHHHFFLNYIDDWDILLGASAASIEVCVIARQADQASYELWLLEDSGRAELPMTDNGDDTLPMGLAVDYTNQLEIAISEEKTLPPTPILLILSTDGVLCPFHMINLNPGVKSLNTPLEQLAIEGERQPITGGSGFTVPSSAAAPVAPSKPSAPPPAAAVSAPNPAAPFASSFAAPFNSAKQTSQLAFSFQPMQGTGVFGASSLKPGAPAPPAQTSQPASSFIPASSTVKVNLKDKFSAVEVPSPASVPNLSSSSFSNKPPASGDPQSRTATFQPQATPGPGRQVLGQATQPVSSTPVASSQKTSKANTPAAKQTPSQPQTNVAKESVPILNAIKEEIAHFQKELDDLKARTAKASFSVGSEAEIRQLKTQTDDLHCFILEIKETTESLHGDMGNLKTNLLEGFANIEDAGEQLERQRDPRYRHLLYKRPLDPKSEGLMQEIRRTHQYVTFAVQDVNDVLDQDWDQYLEKKKKQKSLIVPEREKLFNILANNREIINQQRQGLNQLADNLQELRLYNRTSQWGVPIEESINKSFEAELESLSTILSKTTMDIQRKPKTPPKLSKEKQSQLRTFLNNRKTPPIRSLAPASLNRSSFLAPAFFEDLDDVSSTSSMSEAVDTEEQAPLPPVVQRQETPPPDETPIRAPRHAPVARTSSVQPGFAPPSAPFGKPQFGPGPMTSTPNVSAQSIRVIPQGADSTMLATKTVKHGAPNVPPQQAAAAAALRRQMVSQPPASLTETTLQNVPQVVNVKELKGNGPSPTISTVLGPSVPRSAAQAINLVLATVGSAPAKQTPPSGVLKMHPAPAPSGSTAHPGQGSAPSKTTGQTTQKMEALPVPSPANPTSAPVTQPSKPFSFSAANAGFGFGNVTPASTSSSAGGGNATVASRDPGQPPPYAFGGASKSLFGAGPEGSFSFGSIKSASPSSIASSADTSTAAPPFQPQPPSATSTSSATSNKSEAMMAKQGNGLFQSFPGGETLGSFSGLRVGQVEEVAKAENSKATSNVQPTKPPSSTPVFAFGGGMQPSKPGEVSSTTGSVSGTLFGNLQLASSGSSASVFNQGGSKPNLSFLPLASTVSGAESSSGASAPPATLSFESLLAPAASAAAPAASAAAPAASTLAGPAFSVSAPTSAGSSTLAINHPVKSDKPVSEAAAPPSQPQGPCVQTIEKEQAPTQTVPSATPFASAVNTAVPAALPATLTKAETIPVTSTPVVVGTGQSAITSASAVVSPTSISTPPGGLPSQTLLATPSPLAPPESAPGTAQLGGSTAVSSVFGQPAAPATSAPSAVPVFGQAPVTCAASGPFGQQATSSASTPASTGFGTSTFGLAGTGGGGAAFGQPSFGQTPSLWKAPASSANTFSFAPSRFGSPPAFGQPSTSTAAASSSGGLFGSSSSTSTAGSFSFGQPSSSSGTTTTGGGLFGQSSTPAFGQSSGFGQAAPVFGSTSSSTTTTTSSTGFGFGQSSGFPTSSSGSLFGQSQTPTTSIFGQPSSSGGLFGSSSAASSGGFFSGLGGKPSQEAANKNPFGASTSGFGSSGSPNATSLFGNSGAKTFGFGTPSFGEQKSSGTFSAGGSVASQGFGFTSPAKTGGFGAAPVFGSPPTFGGSPGFGGVPAFGTAPAFASPLGSTGGKVFGEGTAAANAGGFGFGSNTGSTTFGSLATQNTPTFGSLSQNPGFGGQQSSGFSGFGSSTGGASAGTSGGFGFGVSNQSSSTFGGGWRG
ncbi:nuclear pore complex protein Nup214 [Spea bombifrons]|uniref:nuclear pore complex protein Nup214 n=1 Tax=Spea bombifrons TaxID=233779 RepID=UPI00234BF106|nr:nuclear pore complex protein Nup214 [Spea bombifrons]